MLHDIKFISVDKVIKETRLKEGLYIINHFNFDYIINGKEWETYPNLGDVKTLGSILIPEFGAYGVCDSPDQFLEHRLGKFVVNHPLRKFCVSFTHISKKNQPSSGGWRWHKWGPYIGDGEPGYEYLYDEVGFENGVYAFHVYEKVTRS